jgi:hypothetical protein
MTAVSTRYNDSPATGAAILSGVLCVAVVALLALGPGAAAAELGAGRIVAPAAGTIVRAGDTVRVSWTPLPADVEEFELLLSVDGGSTFPLRLTVSLDPALTSYTWRVPNLPAGAARLTLRVGIAGEEIVLGPGPRFEVAGDSAAPTGKITFQGGEWWTTEGVAVQPHELGVEPWWSDAEPRSDDLSGAAVVPPQRQEMGAPRTATSLGGGSAAARLPHPGAAPREALAEASFPKRE